MHSKFNLIILLLALTIFGKSAHAYVIKDFASQRALFIQIEADLKKGKLDSYNKHKQALLNYPLYPYLKYELLLNSIDKVRHSELSAFITTYKDSPLARRLKNEWLKSKVSNNKWKEFLLAYDVKANNTEEMQCNYIHAHLENNNKDVYKYVPAIWLKNKTLPKSCDPVLSSWKKDGRLSRNLSWQRIKLCLNSGNIKLAKYLAKELSDSDQKIVDLWIRTHNDPHIIAKPHYFTANHSAMREIIIHGIKKIAKTDPQAAVKLWKTLEKKHKFNEMHWGSVVKEIGLSLARKYDPHAEKWLATIPTSLLGKDVSDARLKLAVHNNSWESIINTYVNLPAKELQSDKWQYWYARSLEMLGNRKDSQACLIKLAQSRNYYGFLASSRILQPYALNHEVINTPKNIIDSVTQKPAIIRAFELKQIGKIHTGRAEWYQAFLGMNDQERLAAAQIASQWKIPNWAIVALAKADNKNDLTLRFPKTYANFIHKEAKHNKIDPALLFAITRQESAFIPTARSPVGALGLMQVMPNTGKMIARLNSEIMKNEIELLQPEKNIRFGSKYVRMMLNKHQQNPALAAASYNAGPNRVTRWLPEYDMPADSWIETIPFKETREYVQNVLTYTVIYKQLLGITPKLNNYMPIISGTKRVAKK